MRIPIVGPSYDTGVTRFQKQKCINWYVEADTQTNNPSPYFSMLRPTPGIVAGMDFGDANRGRASIVFRDIGYVVLDDLFAMVEEDGTPSYIDVLNTTDSDVAIAGGSNGIIMTDGTNGYFYDIDTYSFSIISDADLPSTPIGCTYFDGYYILVFANSEQLYWSFDTSAWDALDFTSSDNEADYITAAIADHEELWVFGTDTVQVFYNSGDPDAPLKPRPGILITKGCRAPKTIVSSDNTFTWLATDKLGNSVVVRADGYSPKIISDPALGTEFGRYTTVDDAFAFCHRVGLHEFYVLTFPTENKTWVYDNLTKVWTERASIISTDPFTGDYEPLLKAHRARDHFYAYGRHWVLDQYTGSISYYDTDTYTEYDMPIFRERQTSLLSADVNPLRRTVVPRDDQLYSYYNLVLQMERGVALESGQGSDPEIMLKISPDGGYNWIDLPNGKMGQVGEYNNRIQWDTLGQARDLVLNFRITDPVNAVILGATIDEE